MYIKFLDSKTPIKCAVKRISENVVELRFDDEIIVNQSGFRAYKDKECEYDIGGNYYIDFTTMYRNDEITLGNNGYQLSNDGSKYVKPIPVVNFETNAGGILDGAITQKANTYEELTIPTPIPNSNYEFTEWNPSIPLSGEIKNNITFTAQFEYVPTLEEIQEEKVNEMNNEQQKIISAGVDVILSDGTIEHFTLTDHDQNSLLGLKTKVLEGNELIPWHTSNQEDHCKYYSNTDMGIVTETALSFVAYHVTYFRDLRIYIRSLQEKEKVKKIYYGTEIPAKYQSQPLRDMLALQNV